MVYHVFDIKSSGSGIKNENNSSKESARELREPIIKKFKKRKAQSSCKDNISSSDLADIQLTSKFDKENRFLLCVIDIYSY